MKRLCFINKFNRFTDRGTDKLDFFKHINKLHSVGLITKQ